jgi:hypothetical protein
MYNLFKFLVLIFSVFSVFFGLNMSVDAAQKSYDYRMPFRAGEIWKNDIDHGVHTDKTGYGMDFYPTNPSTWEILAPADGTITRGCTVNDVTYLALQTDLGDVFRFVHLDANTVPIQQGFQKSVVRGETLGKISSAKIAEDSKCFLSSELPHTHFSFLKEMCPLQIDGYVFSCDDMKDCGGSNIYSVKCNKIYLGQEFKSTNTPTNSNSNIVEDNYCESLKSANFKSGDNNPIIIGLQKCLKKVGLFDWPAGFTGLFGKYTEGKFNEWKNNTRPVVTQAQVITEAKQITPEECKDLPYQRWYMTQRGSEVVKLQNCLTSMGYFNHPAGPTGYFGNVTKVAYKNWTEDINNGKR